MNTNQTLKRDALDSLSGNWGKSVLAVFLFTIISFALSLLTDPLLNIPGVFEETTLRDDIISYIRDTIINYILLMPLFIGTTWLFQSFVQGDRPSFSSIFNPFTRFWRYMLTGLILTVLLTFWTLLLIVPGIIKYYSYSQTLFILRENPDYSPLQAIQESKAKMHGNRSELFFLHLSFIGWGLLAILTLFIGMFWLEPYFRTTLASFYERKIKQES
ncbi:Uncharacterized membrane protein [Terribacillus aidingensis]|uniref:Uncharacterized membrane protein n=1 Tax=Terribacillus aidingensis TaxID=586416 RepID=A0A285MZ68_9BACI|nr:DUF975 family protein [Terribacillus aidingensis]SNZ02482.1 Uncharacterized membrane protein [Terribacillus aidingensis]